MLALLLGFLTAAAGASEPLRLVTGNAAPFATPARDGFFDLIVAETFRRLGIRTEVRTHESSERALVNADHGDDDGVVARIRGLEAQYPNLLMIPEAIFDNEFIACTLGAGFAISGWRSLQARHVAFIRGWRIFEASVPVAREVTRVRDAGQLFALLQENRAEIVLYERWQALWHARELGLDLRILEPPLARQEMFAYLHRKHAGLVPRAAAALAAMKRDGSYRRIFEATLAPLETHTTRP